MDIAAQPRTNIDHDAANLLIISSSPAELSILFNGFHSDRRRPILASGLESALQQAALARPDIILLDAQPSLVCALEACQQLRLSPATAGVPVIFVLAPDYVEYTNKVFAAGAADYFVKPLKAEEVHARLEVHLRCHLLSRKLEKAAGDLSLAQEALSRREQQTGGRDVQQLAAILDPTLLVEEAVRLVQARFECDFTGIWLLNVQKAGVVLQAGMGRAGTLVTPGLFLAVDNPPCGVISVYQTGLEYETGEISEHPLCSYLPELTGARSELALPLRAGQELVGVLDILSRREDAFDFADRLALRSLADQIAIAVRNAQLYDAEKQRRALAESLEQTGRALSSSLVDRGKVPDRILEQLALVVPYERGLVMLQSDDVLVVIAQHGFPEENRALQMRVPIRSEDVFQQLVATRRTLILDNVTSTPLWKQVQWLPVNLSWMGVPLIVQDRVIGMISLTRREAAAFSQDDASLVLAFAGQAAIALENAKLYSEIKQLNEHLEHLVQERTEELNRAYQDLEKRLRRLSALRTIDMTITSSQDLRLTLQVLLEQTTDQLHVDAASVLLYKPQSQYLEYAASRGFHTAALRHTRLRLGEGYAGQAALERRTVRVPSIVQTPDGLARAPLLPAEGFYTYYAVPLIAKGQIKGVLEIFCRTSFDPEPEWEEFLDALAGQAAIAIDNATLVDELQRANAELVQAYDATIEGWSRAMEMRDRETEGHARRVTRMAERLGQALGMSETELVHLRRGALLHDIGKMGIPDAILLKHDLLSESEKEIMHRHPVYSYELLSSIAYLRPALDIPYAHHERWDGSGYPMGLREEQIPIAARVFAVVDVWDALLSDRPYRRAWPEPKVRDYIHALSGSHFDPHVVRVFLKLIDEGWKPGSSK